MEGLYTGGEKGELEDEEMLLLFLCCILSPLPQFLFFCLFLIFLLFSLLLICMFRFLSFWLLELILFSTLQSNSSLSFRAKQHKEEWKMREVTSGIPFRSSSSPICCMPFFHSIRLSLLSLPPGAAASLRAGQEAAQGKAARECVQGDTPFLLLVTNGFLGVCHPPTLCLLSMVFESVISPLSGNFSN